MNYLSKLREDQTLVMVSGHPQGVYPSRRDAPRLVITNGMVKNTKLHLTYSHSIKTPHTNIVLKNKQKCWNYATIFVSAIVLGQTIHRQGVSTNSKMHL